MRYSFSLMLVGACLLAAPACTQSHVTCPPAPLPPAAFFQVYPISGATAVPDAPQSVVFARYIDPTRLSGLQLVLTPPSGPPVIAGPMGPAPSPLPTPYASPPPGGTLVGFPVPTLSPGTMYQLSFNGTETTTGVCGETFPVEGGGIFTTQ